MGFHEIQFPTDINYGSSGGPGFSTSIIQTDSGAEERIARWDGARRRYNAAYNVKTREQSQDLNIFYIARQGPAFGFRFKDYGDFTTNSDGHSDPTNLDVQIGTGDGVETQFQLIKKYVSGPTTRTRNINKPVTGTTVLAIAGVAQPSGWSVDTTTGVVTFSVAPASGAITAGCEFDVPVRFGREIDALLNSEYSQVDFRNISDVPVVEIIDPEVVSDEYPYGGSAEIIMSTNITITELTGRVIPVIAQLGPLKLILPDPTNMSLGGAYFYIENNGAHSFNITDESQVIITAVAAGEIAVALLSEQSGTSTWIVLI